MCSLTLLTNYSANGVMKNKMDGKKKVPLKISMLDRNHKVNFQWHTRNFARRILTDCRKMATSIGLLPTPKVVVVGETRLSPFVVSAWVC